MTAYSVGLVIERRSVNITKVNEGLFIGWLDETPDDSTAEVRLIPAIWQVLKVVL